MQTPRTTLAQPLWPATTQPKPKGKKTAAGTVKHAEIASGDELTISDDPPPQTTLGPRHGKYTAKFEALPVGKCVTCSSKKTGAVANAMRAWLKKTGREGLGVISMSDYGDGRGRVWLVEAKKDSS